MLTVCRAILEPLGVWPRARPAPFDRDEVLRTLRERNRQHWDPYAASQSSAARVQARRRAQRRTAAPPDPPPGSYYALLGVNRHSSTEQLVRAYRQQVAAIHPDRYFLQPEQQLAAQKRLQALNEAIAVLRDPEQRRRYDAGL